MAQAKMIYTRDGMEFVWHGGAYIEIFIVGGDGSAIDSYNVWDYATDKPTIEKTLDAFTEYVDSKVTESQELVESFISNLDI
jgi:hypothetical protein